MELNHLKYFFFVAKEGGFSRAAKAMGIAQPAISKVIKQVEEELGFQLFERTKRQVHLTKAGGDVFRYCDVIFRQVKQIDRLKPLNILGCTGPLLIGASEAIASHFIPEVLTMFLSACPKVRPSIDTSTSAVLCDKLRGGGIELALLFHTPNLGDSLEVRKSYPIPHRLVISAKRFTRKEVRMAFIGSREIDDPSTKDFPTLRRLQNDLPDAAIIISTNSLTAHKKLVMNGLGVAILPQFMVQAELTKRKLRPLFPKERFEWPLLVVTKKGHIFSEVAEQFLIHVATVATNLMR